MGRVWEVRRDVLLEAVRILDLVPAKSGIPSSDFFLAEPPTKYPDRIWLSTAGGPVANAKVRGEGEWPLDEPFFLDRRIFDPFIGAAREIKNKNPFRFLVTDKELYVYHGTSRHVKFSAHPSIMGYGDVPRLGNVGKLDLPEELLAMMRCAASCAATEAQGQHLACVFMTPTSRGLELLATNQKIVFRAVYDIASSIADRIPFPLPMLDVMGTPGINKLAWDGRCLYALFNTGVVWQTVSGDSLRDFPVDTIRSMFKRGRDTKNLVFKANPARFARVADRMSLYLQSIRKEDWNVVLVGVKGEEKITVINRLPHTVIEERLSTLGPVQRNFEMEWPLDKLGTVLRFTGQVDSALDVHWSQDGATAYVRCGRMEMVLSARQT